LFHALLGCTNFPPEDDADSKQYLSADCLGSLLFYWKESFLACDFGDSNSKSSGPSARDRLFWALLRYHHPLFARSLEMWGYGAQQLGILGDRLAGDLRLAIVDESTLKNVLATTTSAASSTEAQKSEKEGGEATPIDGQHEENTHIVKAETRTTLNNPKALGSLVPLHLLYRMFRKFQAIQTAVSAEELHEILAEGFVVSKDTKKDGKTSQDSSPSNAVATTPTAAAVEQEARLLDLLSDDAPLPSGCLETEASASGDYLSYQSVNANSSGLSPAGKKKSSPSKIPEGQHHQLHEFHWLVLRTPDLFFHYWAELCVGHRPTLVAAGAPCGVQMRLDLAVLSSHPQSICENVGTSKSGRCGAAWNRFMSFFADRGLPVEAFHNNSMVQLIDCRDRDQLAQSVVVEKERQPSPDDWFISDDGSTSSSDGEDESTAPS
ncbi:unnamed protein product, partial [Amoebophrya sp. A25]